MYYFYYFQDAQTKLYYGGITDNIIRRQKQHQKQLNKNLKSDKKSWHLYQDKINLIVFWVFETKSQACVYEKQWIINNYLNPLCLNCSVSNSEYNYNNHALISKLKMSTAEHKILSVKGGGSCLKIRYSLEVNNPNTVYTFKSSIIASKFTKVLSQSISDSCKNAKPYNGSGRWLFSDISIDDLKIKFNKLTQAEIKGSNSYNNDFILTNKNTQKQSQIFYNVYEPQKQNLINNPGNLSHCLLGNRNSVNGYYVSLVI